MKEWKIVYQTVPFNHNHPSVLMVQAETQADAHETGQDWLTRHGYGDTTRIRTVEEYTVKPKGRVLEG